MISLKVRPGEPLERSLRSFKRLVDREGIIRTIKARRYYEKPSERRRIKAALRKNCR